jgi:hypothetical protein
MRRGTAGFQFVQSSSPLLDVPDQIVKLVLLDTLVAVTRLRMGAAVVTNDSIAGVAANPISWRGLNDRYKKGFAGKVTFFDSQITFKFSFFTDRTDFRHFVFFLKVKGATLGRPLPDGLLAGFTDWPCW